MILALWTLSAATGVVVALYGAWDAWQDLRALHGERNGRRKLAWGSMRNQLLRSMIAGIWLMLGLGAIHGGRTDAPLNWFTVGLILGNLLLTLLSALDLRDRIQVRREFEEGILE